LEQQSAWRGVALLFLRFLAASLLGRIYGRMACDAITVLYVTLFFSLYCKMPLTRVVMPRVLQDGSILCDVVTVFCNAVRDAVRDAVRNTYALMAVSSARRFIAVSCSLCARSISNFEPSCLRLCMRGVCACVSVYMY
jgi:hypothetical protein